MTFAVAVSGPEWALIAADTRLQIGEIQEALGFHVHSVRDDALKIWPLAHGWCTMPCSDGWFKRRVLPRLHELPTTDPATIRAAVRTAVAELWPDFERDRPREAQWERERATLFVVGPANDGFFTLGLSWDGSDSDGAIGPAEITARGPRNVSAEAQFAAIRAYRPVIDNGELPDVLRATASLVHAIYVAAGPDDVVSDSVHIGLLVRAGGDVVRLGVHRRPSSELMTASDTEVLGMLVEIVDDPGPVGATG
jgi:hypothetical protein